MILRIPTIASSAKRQRSGGHNIFGPLEQKLPMKDGGARARDDDLVSSLPAAAARRGVRRGLGEANHGGRGKPLLSNPELIGLSSSFIDPDDVL